MLTRVLAGVRHLGPRINWARLTSHHSTTMEGKKALLLLTEGAEEMELVITADVLRRAQINVTIAGLTTTNPVTCSRNVVIVPDKQLKDVCPGDFDALVLPGGLKAANTFAESNEVGHLLKEFESANKLIAVICASPIALQKHGIGCERRVTSHPSVADQLTNYKYVEDRVVQDGSFITSRAPGTAFEFALAVVRYLAGHDKANEITPPMLLK